MTSGSQHGAESGGGLVLCIHQSGSAGNAKFGLKHRIILFMTQSCTLPHLTWGSYTEDNKEGNTAISIFFRETEDHEIQF